MDSNHHKPPRNNNNAATPEPQQTGKPSPHPTGPKDKEATITFEADSPFLNPKAGEDVDEDEDDPFEDEEEDPEERLKHSSFVGRGVLHLQDGVRKVVGVLNERFQGHFFAFVFVLLYLVYFSYAMYYRFGDEGSIRLLWCTILGVIIATRHRTQALLATTSLIRWWTGPKPPATAQRIHTFRFFLRWLMYGGVGAFMGYVIVDVAVKNPSRLNSLPGIVVFLLIGFLFSAHPSRVNWHTIYWSIGAQFILAVLVMKWEGGKEVVLWIQSRLDGFFANSKPASILLFGESYEDHYIIFGAFPIVFLSNAALSMLYHVGAMQFLVRTIGNALRFILDTTAIESTGVAASIFMEGATALLAIRPYLDKLTKSELFAITTGCMASIGGAYLAILAGIGISVRFMLPAMVISAPATFAMCKLVVPETKKPRKITFGGDLPPDMQYSTILEAAQAGAISVGSVVANVVVSAFALFSLISWMNTTLTWIGQRVGIVQLTMESILSYIFYPFALLMGIDPEDCRSVGMLMGLRLTSSSFVALIKMSSLVHNRAQFQEYSLLPNATVTYMGDHIFLDQWNTTLVDGFISRRSEAIATYALCGFSSILSLFINVSILGTLMPKRRSWFISMALPLLVCGNLANFMVGCFAGLLADL